MKTPTVDEIMAMTPEERLAAFEAHIAQRKRSERRWNVFNGVFCLGLALVVERFL